MFLKSSTFWLESKRDINQSDSNCAVLLLLLMTPITLNSPDFEIVKCD